MKSKNTIIALIVTLVIIIIVLIIAFVGLLFSSKRGLSFRWNSKVSNTLVLDKTYENNFANIKITSQMAEIYFKKSSDNNIRVLVYGDKKDVKVNDSSNLLINVENEDCTFLCFNKTATKIEIYLPSDYDKDVDITNSYGDIEIDEFANTNFDIELDYGDINIKSANKLDIKNSYGDITVKRANTAVIDADCGDIEIDSVNDIKADSSYGDIEIINVTNYLNINSDCGDIKIDRVNLNKDSQIKNDFGDVEIGRTNEIYIDASTDLGDVDIKNNYNKSDITLKIDNDCGDIEVNN